MPYPSEVILIVMPVTRIERELDGAGWLVLTPRGHGWLCGDRRAALQEKRWLDNNERDGRILS
jgi:hypothetical protein